MPTSETVTFSRTGDVDLNSLPDPAALPPRVVSPAAALHGHYHERATQPNGYKENRDFAARTDCLRTGARCLSVFHTAPVSVMLLIYNDGTWSYNREDDDKCWKYRAMAHVKYVVSFHCRNHRRIRSRCSPVAAKRFWDHVPQH
ncbi:MAG: serine/threonine protein kinase, bacterial, partial [Mycobacterium sp.]|nr:serine/threonine protein kinase, bacterial [Mycobacterium sp.]